MTQKGVSVLVTGASWAYFTFVARKSVTFLSTVILARLISPDAFGLMGIALLVIAYSEAITDSGMGAALVQRPGESNSLSEIAFLLSLALGLLMTLATFLSAGFIAETFDEPRLELILQVLAPLFLFSAVASVHDSWLKRNFQFKKRVPPQIISVVIKAFVSISLALGGAGVWSLVVGQFASVVAKSGVLRYVTRLPVRLRYETATSPEMLKFGAQLSLVSLLGVVAASIDRLVIGQKLSTEMLGYYTIGAMFPPLIVISVCNAVQQVVFPAFSRMQRTPRLLRKSYLLSVRYTATLTFPLATGLAVVSADFVEVAYGEKWMLAAPVMVFASLIALSASLRYSAGSVFKSTGRARLLTGLTLLQLIAAIPLISWVAHLGIYHIAGAALAVEVILMTLTLILVSRQLKLQAHMLIKQVVPSAIITPVMVIGCMIVGDVMKEIAVSLRLIATIAIGMLIYITGIAILDKPIFEGIIGRIRK